MTQFQKKIGFGSRSCFDHRSTFHTLPKDSLVSQIYPHNIRVSIRILEQRLHIVSILRPPHHDSHVVRALITNAGRGQVEVKTGHHIKKTYKFCVTIFSVISGVYMTSYS